MPPQNQDTGTKGKLLTDQPLSIVLMASGSGTNAESLVQRLQKMQSSRFFRKPYGVTREELKQIQLIAITDHPGAKVIERLAKYDLQLKVIPRQGSREQHENEILEYLQEYNVCGIFLAGYMRLLSQNFVSTYKNKIINIHPSLLPDYPGLNSYERAYRDNNEWHGVTVHLVDEGMDTGPVLAQERFRIDPSQTLEEFIECGKTIENALYPEVMQDYLLKAIKDH